MRYDFVQTMTTWSVNRSTTTTESGSVASVHRDLAAAKAAIPAEGEQLLVPGIVSVTVCSNVATCEVEMRDGRCADDADTEVVRAHFAQRAAEAGAKRAVAAEEAAAEAEEAAKAEAAAKAREPLTMEQLEQLQTDCMADDVDIELGRLAPLSLGQARAFFESGGDWDAVIEQGELEKFEAAHAGPKAAPFDATAMAKLNA